MFQLAVEHRQEKTFSLIYKFDKQNQQEILGKKDNCENNNVLHLVGNFSQHTQINHIRGAALQMQRELQWFKVRNFPHMYIRTYILPYVLINLMIKTHIFCFKVIFGDKVSKTLYYFSGYASFGFLF